MERESQQLVGNRYEIGAELGRGGKGAVYRARDSSTGAEVALKRLLGVDGKAVWTRDELRFRREFHTLASLHHPCIVEAFDYGEYDAGAFYTMELLEGKDLKAVSPMAPARACAVLRRCSCQRPCRTRLRPAPARCCVPWPRHSPSSTAADWCTGISSPMATSLHTALSHQVVPCYAAPLPPRRAGRGRAHLRHA